MFLLHPAAATAMDVPSSVSSHVGRKRTFSFQMTSIPT
ncbi:WSSV609 [White spot syndrome virus]|uniref:WSSV609 n=1 Tax=White spot syndrome virus TaxID=342409 RepID=A0A2I6SCN4_9VIRU|nr:WSSV609 [White spot syndrome virus]